MESSPAIGSDGTIYVGSDDNNVYAINPADGSQKWVFKTGDSVESSPAIGSDGTIYVGSDDNNVYAINAADGSLKWKLTTKGQMTYSSSAIGADGTVYVGSGDDNVYAIGWTVPSVALTSSQNPAVLGLPIKFTATVSAVAPATGTPGGTVTFLDGTTPLGTQTLVKGVAVLSTPWDLSLGSHTITVSYSGDSSFKPSASKALTQVVSQGSASVGVASSQSPAWTGQSVTLTATVSAVAPAIGVPRGTVTFRDGTTILGSGPVTLSGKGQASYSISILSLGSHNITASYSGDTDFTRAVSTALTQVIILRAVTIRLSSSQNPASPGQTVTLSAAVVPAAPATGTPTGTVTFLDGATMIGGGPMSLDTNAQVTFSTASLSSGSHTLTVSYSGDGSFIDGTSPALTQVVSQSIPSVELTSSQNPSLPGQTVIFTVVVSAVAPSAATPTGTVTFLSGLTALGTETLVNGVATLSTSSLPDAVNSITAFYSGDATFVAASSPTLLQAVTGQVTAAAWRPGDISVGSDDLSRVLWSSADGRSEIWSIDQTTGDTTQGPVFGPYDGGAWQAARIACGSDGISYILWNKEDGTLSLWWVGADNTFQKSMDYGPFEGWFATDLSVGSDNLVRILWTNIGDGRAVVWSVDANGVASNNTNFYGPYPGYTAVALACGSDGLTRLVWANPVGSALYWVMNAENQQESSTTFGPYAGWIPRDIDVGSDNLARLLWTNTVDGRAIVWSVDANGNPANNQSFYGPFTGYTAQHAACGSDGFTRVTWVSAGDVLSLWNMASNNTMLKFNIYGPYISP